MGWLLGCILTAYVEAVVVFPMFYGSSTEGCFQGDANFSYEPYDDGFTDAAGCSGTNSFVFFAHVLFCVPRFALFIVCLTSAVDVPNSSAYFSASKI